MKSVPRAVQAVIALAFAALFVLAAIAYWPHPAGLLAILAVLLLLPLRPWQQLLERLLKRLKTPLLLLVAVAVFLIAPSPSAGGPLSEAVSTTTTTATAFTSKTAVTTLTTLPSATTASHREVTYILNRSSKKFHLPDCAGASKIANNNRQEYRGERQALLDDGYSPCGTCHP